MRTSDLYVPIGLDPTNAYQAKVPRQATHATACRTVGRQLCASHTQSTLHCTASFCTPNRPFSECTDAVNTGLKKKGLRMRVMRRGRTGRCSGPLWSWANISGRLVTRWEQLGAPLCTTTTSPYPLSVGLPSSLLLCSRVLIALSINPTLISSRQICSCGGARGLPA